MVQIFVVCDARPCGQPFFPLAVSCAATESRDFLNCRQCSFSQGNIGCEGWKQKKEGIATTTRSRAADEVPRAGGHAGLSWNNSVEKPRTNTNKRGESRNRKGAGTARPR